MSAFIIYAIVLTLAYIIYYSAMITKDAYARKEQTSDTSETFDVGDMNGQIESVTVNESKHGFYLGDENADEEDNAGEEESTDVTADDHEATDESDSESDAPSKAEQHAESAEAMMEEIDPEFSDSFEPDEFDLVLLNPANTVPVITNNDTRDEL